MSDYGKPSVIPAWAETANNPADLIVPDNAFVSAGWPLSGTPPSRQRFNFILNWVSNGIRYFMQRGIADWDANENYRVDSRVIGDDGKTYRSKLAYNHNNVPSATPDAWEPWGLTLSQINASQLTQADINTGDASAKVANTNFVSAAVNAVLAAANNAINTAIGNVNNRISGITLSFPVTEQNINGYFGGNFTNTTPFVKMVNISAQVGSGGAVMYATVDGVERARVGRPPASNSDPAIPAELTFAVPPGSTYTVTQAGGNTGGFTIIDWVETTYGVAINIP